MSGNAIENMKISVIFEAIEAFFFSDPFSFFFFFRYFEIEEIPTMKTEIKKTGRSTLLLGTLCTQTLGKIFLEKMNSIERFFDRCKYFHKNNYFS